MMEHLQQSLPFPSGPRLRFTRRPVPVPSTSRVEWQIAAVCLILARSRGYQSSLERLHTLVWALQSVETRRAFIAGWHGGRDASLATERLSPLLPLTLPVARADGLVELTTTSRFRLTTKGQQLAERINASAGMLQEEKAFLESLGGAISDADTRRRVMTATR
jgi:hypothetical protein